MPMVARLAGFNRLLTIVLCCGEHAEVALGEHPPGAGGLAGTVLQQARHKPATPAVTTLLPLAAALAVTRYQNKLQGPSWRPSVAHGGSIARLIDNYATANPVPVVIHTGLCTLARLCSGIQKDSIKLKSQPAFKAESLTCWACHTQRYVAA
jgi:hypothetical protein